MSNNTEEKSQEDKAATSDSGVTVKSGSEHVATHSRRRTNRTALVAIVAVVAITAVLILVWVLWRSGSSGGGRPVPTPRNIGAEQPGSTASTSEPTISIDPEVAKRAGIKTEPVGEAILAGGVIPGQ